MTRLRVALAQINTVVGDLDANCGRIVAATEEAANAGAQLVVFPELTVCGYPPEDLVLRPSFVEACEASLVQLAKRTADWPDLALAVGSVWSAPHGASAEAPATDSASVLRGGSVEVRYDKRHLPNYAVFDERRYFQPGSGPVPTFEVAGARVAMVVCEDTWVANGPVAAAAAAGAQLVVVLNASPYFAGRLADREEVLCQRARESGVPLVYVNLVGGQDELVFDGGSLVVDRAGQVVARLPQFDEAVTTVELDFGSSPSCRWLTGPTGSVLPPVDEMYDALVTGTRDYVDKNSIDKVWIGLSGGVDSALVATIAVDALGAERVHTVAMPSRYSSPGSLSDADLVAGALGVDHRVIGIESAHVALAAMLASSFGDALPGLAEENLQSRIRGVVLMALSNKLGGIVLSTGNKSELAVGYATLYGDMNGGFNPIKDVFKTKVYELCRLRNERAASLGGPRPIPDSILSKPPSAELRPEQRDDQNLPPYDVLDAVLLDYIERDLSVAAMVDAGHDDAIVRRIVGLVDASEHKRRQAPPGVRVTPKAFGRDRRLPITHAFRD